MSQQMEETDARSDTKEFEIIIPGSVADTGIDCASIRFLPRGRSNSHRRS